MCGLEAAELVITDRGKLVTNIPEIILSMET